MAEHRPHPTDTTADIPEADLLEQQTPLLTEDDPLEAAPSRGVTGSIDGRRSRLPRADHSDSRRRRLPAHLPTGDTDG